MSYLAYPPRLPVEFSESVAQLISLTLKIKNEVAPNKNEFNEALATWGRASKRKDRPLDAHSCLMRKQTRKSRYWISFAGEDSWLTEAELNPEDRLKLADDLLKYLEDLFRTLQTGCICPLTKVNTLRRVLAKRPILSIRQLSEDAIVSESTAKRWLRALEANHVLSSVIKDGQRQFVNDELITIIENFV